MASKYKVDMSDYPKWFNYDIPPRAKELPVAPNKFLYKNTIVDSIYEDRISKEKLISLDFDGLVINKENDYDYEGNMSDCSVSIKLIKYNPYENKNYEKQLAIYNKKVQSITKYNNTIEMRFNKWKSLKDKHDDALKALKELTKPGKKNVKAV